MGLKKLKTNDFIALNFESVKLGKRAAILLFLAAFCVTANAQCPQFEPGLQVGTVAHNSLDEVSGIATSRQNSDVLWVHNDMGGQPRVFAMNRQGTHLGIYNLSGATNYDWEDIAIGPGPVGGVDYLYVGDIGDSGSRINIKVYRVAEPVVYSQQSPIETTLTGVDTITLVYPDGARNAEALMVDPVTKDIYIISKDDSPSRVYRAPYPQSTTATITMEYKCELPWNKAAGSDISVDGDMVIVKTGESSGNRASVWLRPAGTNLWDAFSGTECTVPFLSELNGEAVCFDGDGWGYYTTSEELHQPIHYFASVNTKLSITEIMSDSAHSGSTGGDWWELTYAGSATVDLTGYSWDDDSDIAGTVTFGNITIGPNESIIILDDDGSWVASWKSEWGLGSEVNVYDYSDFSGTFPGLGSSDGVFLYNPGDRLVTSVTYPSRTTGFSNEWETDGTFLGLSVIGENGAYQSLNGSPDVGSPGYAVIIISSPPKTIYVDADAPGPTHDGSNWHDAYLYLQDGLADATSGDEIRVAQGIYKPDQGIGQTAGDRNISFQLENGVVMKGGYSGYGEADPNERNIDVYESILSGDLDSNDANVADARDLLGEPTRSENSYHVITGRDIDETTVLNGFTITAGNANGPDNSGLDRGGGMFNNGEDSQCNPTITNCTFIGNSASQHGGAMMGFGRDGQANPVLTDCMFIGNAAGEIGGGMYNWECQPVLINCIFRGNYALYGGGMCNHGDTIVINCTFSNNIAEDVGGGMRNLHNSSPIITNSTFTTNYAGNGGGGMCNEGSSPNIANCTFYSNTARVTGGGMQNDAELPGPVVSISNCIFWDNNDIGGTDESAQIDNYNYSTLVINYSCVQGWTGGLGGSGNHGDAPLFVDANGVDNIAGTEDDNLRLSMGSPCFDAGDNTALPSDITDLDSDANTTEPIPWDLDGNPRIINGTVDMGAYELGPKTETCSTDFNDDLFVNFHDFCVLAQEWLETGDLLETDLIDDDIINELDLAAFVEPWLTPCYECSEADIYSDGKIDFEDYSILADNWLQEGPNLDGDITGNWVVNMLDLKVLVFHWLNSCE